MEEQNFDTWLSVCLNAAGLDGEVFSGYISGTLGTMEDSSPQEIEESLLDILQGCLVSWSCVQYFIFNIGA